MKCSDILGNLGFDCAQVNENLLRVWSPFTYGDDGEEVGVYVEKLSDGFVVSDNAEAMMHAASMGISLSKNRLATLRNVAGHSVTIADGGEITAAASAESVPDAVATVIGAALGVGHLEAVWRPRHRNAQDFVRQVGDVLDSVVGKSRVSRDVKVTGASGHQIEIPFVIADEIYVQPVAYGDGKVQWDNVYRGLGKMIDLKNAGASDRSRIIVVEDASNDAEIANAVSLLSITANVVQFSKIESWARKIAI